jgi:hypothetical protein
MVIVFAVAVYVGHNGTSVLKVDLAFEGGTFIPAGAGPAWC